MITKRVNEIYYRIGLKSLHVYMYFLDTSFHGSHNNETQS